VANSLTGSVNANIEYRFYQEDDTYSLEDIGRMQYNLDLPYGTGYGQANDVWYAEREHSGVGVESIDLSLLTFTRLNYQATTSFIGPDIGNIKGFRIFNKSVNNLYCRYSTVDFFLVPPSGDIQFSNFRGWNVDNGDTIDISGNGSVQSYDIVLIGSGIPIVVNSLAEVNIEFREDTTWNTIINLEHTKGIAYSGSAPIEYLISNSSDLSGSTNIEFRAGISVIDNIINIEYRGNLTTDNIVNVEFGETNIILPQNRHFNTSYTTSELEALTPDSETDPYAHWEITWDDTSFPNDCSFRTNNITLSLTRKNVVVGGVTQKRIYIGEKSPNEITINQIISADAGQDYRFTASQIGNFRSLYYIEDKATIKFYDSLDNVLYTYTEEETNDPIDFTFTSPDTVLRMEIHKPANDWSSFQGPGACNTGTLLDAYSHKNYWVLWNMLLEEV
jgi:hypothetical protein